MAKEAVRVDSKLDYKQQRAGHWGRVFASRGLNPFNAHYHRRLGQVYQFHIPKGSRVLELGCGTGDLLAAVKPSLGVGVDFSPKAIELAGRKHPELEFLSADVEQAIPSIENDPFDFIILSDLLNDLWDVQDAFHSMGRHCRADTRILMNFYSRLWQVPLLLAQKLGLAKPVLLQNWLTKEDVANLLYLSGFEVIKSWNEMLLPLPIPLIDPLFNRFLVKLWPFKSWAITNFILARPIPPQPPEEKKYTASVIVPARNEEGNIENIFRRTPQLGAGTELIFVEGHSKDDTFGAIERAMKKYPHIPARLLRQDGIGKGDAVRKGFLNSSGDILMILDADLTVSPEDLAGFYQALASGKGDFINGVRLIYPREKEAMRFLNFLGNKFFSLAFSWLLGQPVKDTLCGTKVLWKKDYLRIAANRAYFGDFDPFGDFDLLFGAARLGLKIVDYPIRYQERKYGTTNIQRWKHGWLLLKMVAFAARRIKFV